MQVPDPPHFRQVPQALTVQQNPSVQWPELHWPLVLQGTPLARGAEQALPLQNRPLLHVEPLQHCWPAAPQAQVPALVQVRPLPQLPLQHGCPLPPHVTQVLFEQDVPPAVHAVPDVQQG
jgi:hypothetical protein